MILKIYKREQQQMSPDSNATETIMVTETIDKIDRVSTREFGDRRQDNEHKYIYFSSDNGVNWDFSIDIYDEDLVSAYLMNDRGQTVEVLKR